MYHVFSSYQIIDLQYFFLKIIGFLSIFDFSCLQMSYTRSTSVVLPMNIRKHPSIEMHLKGIIVVVALPRPVWPSRPAFHYKGNKLLRSMGYRSKTHGALLQTQWLRTERDRGGGGYVRSV